MRHISDPIRAIANRLSRRRHDDHLAIIRLAALCESPIENMFWVTGYTELSRLGKFTPQVKVPPYRLDFALVSRNFKLAIECDGYEFHSSEVQISSDNSRDLELACKGWIVVRFTGSRIWRDTQGCVKDVARLVRAVRK